MMNMMWGVVGEGGRLWWCDSIMWDGGRYRVSGRAGLIVQLSHHMLHNAAGHHCHCPPPLCHQPSNLLSQHHVPTHIVTHVQHNPLTMREFSFVIPYSYCSILKHQQHQLHIYKIRCRRELFAGNWRYPLNQQFHSSRIIHLPQPCLCVGEWRK